MSYAVVLFTEEKDSCGVIATNWMTPQKSSCMYPVTRSDTKRIKTIVDRAAPENGWQKCRIRVLRSYTSYENAMEHLKEAEYTSHLEESDGELPKKRRRRERAVRLPGEEESSSSNDGSGFIPPISSYPTPPISDPCFNNGGCSTPTSARGCTKIMAKQYVSPRIMSTPQTPAQGLFTKQYVSPAIMSTPQPPAQDPFNTSYSSEHEAAQNHGYHGFDESIQNIHGQSVSSEEIVTSRAVFSPPFEPAENSYGQTQSLILSTRQILDGDVYSSQDYT